MTIHNTFRGIAGVAAVAVAMTLGTGAALANPAGGPFGPGGHGAQGGHGGPAEMIGHLIAGAKAELKLNTMQQQMFDMAVTNSKAALESGRALHGNVKATLQAELAKPEPDLAAVAAAADAAMEQGRTLRKAIRTEWLALYAQFSPEQKVVVRDLLQKRMGAAEGFRHKMQERMHQFRSGTAG